MTSVHAYRVIRGLQALSGCLDIKNSKKCKTSKSPVCKLLDIIKSKKKEKLKKVMKLANECVKEDDDMEYVLFQLAYELFQQKIVPRKDFAMSAIDWNVNVETTSMAFNKKLGTAKYAMVFIKGLDPEMLMKKNINARFKIVDPYLEVRSGNVVVFYELKSLLTARISGGKKKYEVYHFNDYNYKKLYYKKKKDDVFFYDVDSEFDSVDLPAMYMSSYTELLDAVNIPAFALYARTDGVPKGVMVNTTKAIGAQKKGPMLWSKQFRDMVSPVRYVTTAWDKESADRARPLAQRVFK